MILHCARRAWVAAGAIVLAVGLTPPALANHVAPADAKEAQGRPIQLGVSGSSQTLLLIKSLLYCYTGTLGALVQDSNRQYILSNNHVLAKENGKLDYGEAGENATIIQPGLLDEGPCALNSGDPTKAVADLSAFVEILFGKGKNKPANAVDAAIAEVRDNQVDPRGSILGIGPVGDVASTVDPGLPVQKTGRTTAHTFGTVMAVGVTVDVSYDSGTARFVNQIRIRRPCGDAGFSDAGDSGSLIVTAPASGEPAVVGLLFAGGGSDTFANPIGPVLDLLEVSMVTGNDGTTTGAMLSDHQAIASSCPTGSGGGGPGRPGGRPPGLTVAKNVAARHSDQIFALPDVTGHGIGADQNGNAVIEVYVASKGRRGVGPAYPSDIEGIPVRVIETGPIRAY